MKKRLHILIRMEMYQFYLKISQVNEKVNTICISPETFLFYFDVALNKRNAGQGTIFRVWLLPCNDSMSLAVRKWFLILNVIFEYNRTSNVFVDVKRRRRRKESQF